MAPKGAQALARPRPPGIRRFGQEDGRSGVFAADRQALEKAEHDHEQRRREADFRVARQEPDSERRKRHGHHRPQEGWAAPDPVADIAEEHGADGAHQEPGGEDAIGDQQGRRLVVGREIEAADGAREIAVNREVVPFHHVAGDARHDHAPALVVLTMCFHWSPDPRRRA